MEIRPPQTTTETRESQLAFELAIEQGILSDNPSADNYAAKYMYMYTMVSSNGLAARDYFKHRMTRKYLPGRAFEIGDNKP